MLLGALFLALLIIDVSQAVSTSFAWDFRAFYDGGRDYLHLRSPYISGSLADLTSRRNFVYPLPTAALLAPVSLLPYHLAAVLFVAASAGLLVASLCLVGVRDPWCYAAVLVGAPALDALEIGTVSPILAFLLAVVWRYRNRTSVVALALSLAVLLKLFLWPLGVWLLATRRSKSLAGAIVIAVVAVAASAAPLGLDPLRHYPHLLRMVSTFEGPSSLSLVGVGTALTGSTVVGVFMSLAFGALLLTFVVRRGLRGDESFAFRLAIVASLALTPIVWNHYLVLLYVAIGMVRPRFSPAWLGTAWVFGAVHGDALGGGTLVVALFAIWTIVLAQAGVLSLERDLVGQRVGRVGEVLAIWVALVWSLVALVDVVPAVAALRGHGPNTTSSGTANLRLLHSGSVCMTVLTSGVPLPASVELVDVEQTTALLRREVTGERTTTCVRHPRAGAGGDLADAFTARRVKLELRIVDPSRRVLLSGIVVRPSDAR